MGYLKIQSSDKHKQPYDIIENIFTITLFPLMNCINLRMNNIK